MTISIEQTRRDIQALQLEQQRLQPLPDIAAHERHLMLASAKASVDINLRGEVVAADMALKAAHAAHKRNAEINSELQSLERQLSMAEAEQRTLQIEEATKKVQSLHNEFNAQAKSLCRLYEQMHQQNLHAARTVPGYRPIRLPEFNLPMMLPAGWQGVTSELIKTHSLPWLNAEKKEAA